jgi:hypothetical protein
MVKLAFGMSAAALAGVLLCGLVQPSAAEQSDVREYAAQSRPRIVVHPRHSYPGPNAKRYCVSWLAKENRPSGPVITPQMRCWWR